MASFIRNTPSLPDRRSPDTVLDTLRIVFEYKRYVAYRQVRQSVEKPKRIVSQNTPGRKRSEEVHQAILLAAREILEKGGYRAVTVEGIARRAGAGKKTIYRWWSSKAQIVMEALIQAVKTHTPFRDTGSLKGDLHSYFELSFPGLRDESGKILKGLAAEAQLDPDFAAEFQRVFIVPRKKELVALLARAAQRGELAANLSLEALADMIYGAKWYRFLLYPAPLNDAFARDIVEIVASLGASR
jgi:AcrR family transcriptional regulator